MIDSKGATKEQLLDEISQLKSKIKKLESIDLRMVDFSRIITESEERYQGIIRNTVNCVVVYQQLNSGKDFTITEFNPMAEKVEMISKDKVIGKKVTEAFPGVIEFGLFKVLQDVFNTGRPQHFPVSKYKDGRMEGYRENYIYKLSSGEIVVIYKDLSGDKEILDALEIKTKNLRNTLEGTNAGTWDWNVQTGELELNERWAEIMGYSLSELAPVDVNTWINNVHSEDLPYANVMLNKLFNREINYFDVVFRQPHKKGGWVWVNARGKVVEWTVDGNPLRMSGTHLDITQRKNAEEELSKHREHLEELVKERTKELEDKNKELDHALLVFVGREQTIKNLEERIKTLEGN